MAVLSALAITWLLCLPRDLFKGTSYSTVVTDRNGELLGARIADDGQWRFPPCDSVPDKFAAALIEFEDKGFRHHPGIDPMAVGRAVVQNIRGKKIVSGASTITMQVIRLSRNRERTIWQKIAEAWLATRLEARYSKDRILALYASHAPFGGNVVGLEAAAWRYFGRGAEDLSWSEAATLAVLPNSPALIHPGRNRDILLKKRNALLERLRDKGYFSAEDCILSCEEPLPGEPLPLPSYASHLVDRYAAEAHGKMSRTAIDLDLQTRVEEVVGRWNDELSRTGINDLAAIVIDVASGEILAYCGNANPEKKRPGANVDILRSPRSTGSILKPFLYCACLQDGEILPDMLLADTPVNINGFTPQNFDLQYAGAVPASTALARSLNVPSVHLLRKYGVPKFHALLKERGMTTLTREPGHYGLSLILGGAEARLLDIAGMYRDLAAGDPAWDKVARWYTLEALSGVNRPDEIDWRLVSSVRKVAWKTGTSYGFRDAWAVGMTTKYVVGVWAGNAQGQGVPGLVGGRTAGPVMFDIFNLLPRTEWFEEPFLDDGVRAEVCCKSGHLAGPDCEERDTLLLPKKALTSEVCPYHRTVKGESRFLLPPAMEAFYRQHHPEYKVYRDPGDAPMEFIYPENGSVLGIPVQLDGTVRGIVFNLAHRNPDTTVHWHLDNNFVGSTRYIHQLELNPGKGKHTVTAVDADGNSVSIGFLVEE